MAGVNQKVIAKRPFDFSTLSGSQSQTVVVAKALPVSRWRELLLLVRLHHRNAWTSGQSLTVHVVADGYTAQDPNTDFVDNVSGPDLAAITLTSGSAAPGLYIAAASFLSNNLCIGAYVTVTVRRSGSCRATKRASPSSASRLGGVRRGDTIQVIRRSK